MLSLGNQVRHLVDSYDRKTKMQFGGLPFSANIDSNIMNYYDFLAGKLPVRQRVTLGACALDGRVIGYWEATVMSSANPTAYERKFMGLSGPLDYFHCKKLIVAPEYRGTQIAAELMNERISIAKTLGKDMVADVTADNARIIAFLQKFSFEQEFPWKTRNGTSMYRFRRDT